MDREEPAEEIRQIAGQVRLLAALLSPVPHRPAMDRGVLEKALQHLATDLDRVARNTERRHCPTGTREDQRP